MPKTDAEVADLLNSLRKLYPAAGTALRHGTALELLVATILSAQCTDARVNIVTKTLFKKYRKASDYLAVPVEELETDIKSTGFFRNKARSIRGACEAIERDFGGRVPDTMEELVKLPGVGRKTANCVLGNFYGKAEGVVVDTHVLRISRLLGLTRRKEPEKVEKDLIRLVAKDRWIDFSNLIILHGRAVCKARNPGCGACAIRKLCDHGRKRLLEKPN
jgi:endonuclease-3